VIPKYPDITVRLSGSDGNAFLIMGKVIKALKKNGASEEEIEAYKAEATSGDYEHLLQTCFRWVEID
jgi:hypothetical protein